MKLNTLLAIGIFCFSSLTAAQAYAQLRTMETRGEVIFVGGDNFDFVSYGDILLVRHTFDDNTLPSFASATNATYEDPIVYVEVFLFPRGTADFSPANSYYQECGRDALVDVFDNFGETYDAVLTFGTLNAKKKLPNSDFVGAGWQLIFETAENMAALATTSLKGPVPDAADFTAPYPPSQKLMFTNKNTNTSVYIGTDIWHSEEIKTPASLRCSNK